MVKNNKIIEIKGQQYDATTGERVTNPETRKKPRNLDGVVSKKSTAKTVQSKPASSSKLSTSKSAPVQKPIMQDVRRRPIFNVNGHAPEHPKTLMRSAVQKPKSILNHTLRVQSPTDVLMEKPQLRVAPKLLVDTVNNDRLRHAKGVSKSQLISHYNPQRLYSPLTRPTMHETVAPTRPTLVQARPARRPQTTAELLEHAVAQATSHEQPPVRPVKRRLIQQYDRRTRHTIGIVTMSAVAVLLIGFVVHQNMPNISLDLASGKAGFTAAIPSEAPSGFSLARLSASVGEVAINFHSNSDDSRSYTITEKPSTWDNVTLRDMYVSQVAPQYQIVQAGGQTLYLYGQQNVTWVSGGIWYLVKSNGSLSNQQLINIATSL